MERAVEVGEVVAEGFDVLDAVFVDADLSRLRVGEDDVPQKGLFEVHCAAECLSSWGHGGFEADHVEFEAFGCQHSLD